MVGARAGTLGGGGEGGGRAGPRAWPGPARPGPGHGWGGVWGVKGIFRLYFIKYNIIHI